MGKRCMKRSMKRSMKRKSIKRKSIKRIKYGGDIPDSCKSGLFGGH